MANKSNVVKKSDIFEGTVRGGRTTRQTGLIFYYVLLNDGRLIEDAGSTEHFSKGDVVLLKKFENKFLIIG